MKSYIMLYPIIFAVVPFLIKKKWVKYLCVLFLLFMGIGTASNQAFSIGRNYFSVAQIYSQKKHTSPSEDYHEGYKEAVKHVAEYKIFFTSTYIALAIIALLQIPNKKREKETGIFN